jgi:TRAP-type C4-dicarboxylate transport system substrate-binding protein
MKRLAIFFILVSLLVGLAFVFTGCTSDTPAPGEETFNWRLQCAYSEADMEYIALDPFIEAIKKGTDGRLNITKFSGGTIVPEEEQLEANQRGVIEINHASGGYWRGIVPVGDVDMGLPGQYPGFRTLDEFKHMVYEFEDGALIKTFREAYSKQAGVYFLGNHSYHGYPVFISKVPIRTMDDFKGLVVRATGATADLVEAIGTATTFIPGGEMYMALSLGTIDVATWSVEGFIGYNWYEVAPYIMVPTISEHNASHLTINQEAWDALPAAYQEVVQKAYLDVYLPALFDLYEDEWQTVYDKQAELKYEIIEMEAETLTQIRKIAREKIWPQIADKDEYTRKAVDIVMRWHEQYGK